MGVGFLAMLAGILHIDTPSTGCPSTACATASGDVLHHIPMMKPQMLFGAVMAVVNTFQVGYIGVRLSGMNPTPGYFGQLMVNHIEDFGFIRYDGLRLGGLRRAADHGVRRVKERAARVWEAGGRMKARRFTCRDHRAGIRAALAALA